MTSRENNSSRRKFLKMSGLVLAVGTTASVPVTARTVDESAADDIEILDIGRWDTVIVPDGRYARVYRSSNINSEQIDRVPPGTTGTVRSFTYGLYHKWYKIYWNIERDVADGWIPRMDIEIY